MKKSLNPRFAGFTFLMRLALSWALDYGSMDRPWLRLAIRIGEPDP
jgi:hypothetical protein